MWCLQVDFETKALSELYRNNCASRRNSQHSRHSWGPVWATWAQCLSGAFQEEMVVTIHHMQCQIDCI